MDDPTVEFFWPPPPPLRPAGGTLKWGRPAGGRRGGVEAVGRPAAGRGG